MGIQNSTIRVGTRGSPLALIQAHLVQEGFKRLGVPTQIVPIKTQGDLRTDVRLADIGGKALFTKELEAALVLGEMAVAVHSMKDVEAKRPAGLIIGAYLPREDPRDGFISPQYQRLENLPEKAKIGTSSPRRAAQLLKMYPHFQILPLRGNIQTRLEKTQQGHVDGTFLAVAGLKRAGLAQSITQVLEIHEMLPAAGQGAIGVECLENRQDIKEMLQNLDHLSTRQCVEIERAFQEAIQADCYTPLGALAQENNGVFTFKALVTSEDGSHCFYKELSGDHATVYTLAKTLGEEARQWLMNAPSTLSPSS